MDLTRDAIVEIQDTAVKANGQRIFKGLPEPDDIYLLLQPDGSLKKQQAEREQHRIRLDSLRAVVDFVQQVAAEKRRPTVWYGPGGIFVTFNPQTRPGDAAGMPLEFSVEYAVLRLMRSEKSWLKQADLVKALRVDLAKTLSNQPELLTTVRTIKAATAKTAEGDVQHGRESLGLSVNAAVTGSGPLPEQVMLAIEVFDEPGLGPARVRWPVCCALLIEPTEVRFALWPLPGEIEQALDNAVEHIGTELRTLLGGQEGEPVPIFRGHPNGLAESVLGDTGD